MQQVTVFINSTKAYSYSRKPNAARKGRQPRDIYGRFDAWSTKPKKRAKTRKHKTTNWNTVAIVFVLILAGFVNYVQSM